jgi:hypothetical protein
MVIVIKRMVVLIAYNVHQLCDGLDFFGLTADTNAE